VKTIFFTTAEQDKKESPMNKKLEDLFNLPEAKEILKQEDLMDLGMSVEARFSGRVFEVAGNMLRTSLDAKIAKIDKKLKMIDLQLKKEKQDKDVTNDSNFTEGEGYVVTDRNSLLQRLKGIDKDK